MNTHENPPSPRHPPDAQMPASFSFYYCVYLSICLVPATLLLAFFFVLVPQFRNTFKTFKTTLPAITEWTLAAAELVRSGLWIAIVLAPLVFPLLLAFITARQPARSHRMTHVMLVLILMLLFLLITGLCGFTSLYLPFIKYIDSVSGSEINP